jgi:chorismate synthase
MNTFGRIFRVSIFGESHGEAIGVLIDGCPAGIAMNAKDFLGDLERRKGGMRGTTERREEDIPWIKSGVFQSKTTGGPILLLFENENIDSQSYEEMRFTPRPGHADFVAFHKYGGHNDLRGGGHFSGRLTAGLVAAGTIAKSLIAPINIHASIIAAGGSAHIDEAVNSAISGNDSIGGIIECTATGMPIGLGEPFFDSVESLISHMAFSVPAVKGIEFGAGFEAGRMRGSLHNDPIISSGGETATNNAGGVNGGITNGNDILFRVAVKPTSSIGIPQQTIDVRTGEPVILQVSGRHDTCIALRVPVIMEAITAIVLADLLMVEKKIFGPCDNPVPSVSPNPFDLDRQMLLPLSLVPTALFFEDATLKRIEKVTARLEYLKHIIGQKDSEELQSFLHGLADELQEEVL